MARTQMLSSEPTNIVPQPVSISHVQLRDVMLCPDEPGVVDFVQGQNILERDITDPSSTPTHLANLNFVPNTIASLPVPDSHERLIAAGGQEAELHLSLHSGHPSSARRRGSLAPVRSQRLWQYDSVLSGSINNSVLLTSLSLTRSHESSAEPRVAVSNNDCTVKFYDVNVRGSKGVDGPPKRISEAGTLRVDVPVNHSSISPDGRTLLSVGDSPQVYLHALTGGAQITFTQLSTLTLPPFDEICVPTYASALPACFSTAFSSCGTKFAVASQEGMVVVWDVRSYKPMKVFQTDRTRSPGRVGNNAASGWLYEDSWDWARAGSRAPGWGVRNVKFSPAGHGGKELMVFTEHTSLLHVIDATTFENEEIIRVPSVIEDSSSRYTSQPSTPPVPESEAATWASQIPRLPPVPPPQPRIVLYNARTGSTTDYTSRSAPGSSSFLSAHTATVSPARAHHYRRTRRRLNASEGAEDDSELVVIPPLGDRNVERDVRRILGRHGLRAAVRDNPDGDDEDDDAEPDELAVEVEPERDHEHEHGHESDCLTSRANSPAPAPAPAPVPAWRLHEPYRPPPRAKLQMVVPPHLDLAGACFDPRGQYLYVASTGSVVEWSVRGAEKRWWGEAGWA
ncbi:hypothetical protein DENSPDRAFT_844330 [Dentipellis sp. KUC8613]|nr:hypothetical protein DENSPDRAFT_844330 [Dentipellis sp. KUC8613]